MCGPSSKIRSGGLDEGQKERDDRRRTQGGSAGRAAPQFVNGWRMLGVTRLFALLFELL